MSKKQSKVSLEDISHLLRTKFAIFTDFVVLIDRRTCDWDSVYAVVSKLNQYFTANLSHIYVLKPQGFMQRFFVEKTIAWIRDASKCPISFVEKTSELTAFIDPQHLPTDLGGQLKFDVEQWIQDRMCIEEFRDRVEDVCARQKDLIDSLRGGGPLSSSTSLIELKTRAGATGISRINSIYASRTVSQLRHKRRHWLETIQTTEQQGLSLRRRLRAAPAVELNPEGMNGSVKVAATTDEKVSTMALDCVEIKVPVDRVFHVITLERLIVRLTEVRTEYGVYWSEYAKRARIVKLIGDVEDKFYEFQPLLSVWNNAVESAVEYHSTYTRRFKSQEQSDSPSPGEVAAIDSVETECSAELDAVLSRLREAEDFGRQLTPDLLALSKTTEWLITYIKTGDTTRNSPISVVQGINSLTRFHLHSDSESDTETTMTNSQDTAIDTVLAEVELPPDAYEQWPALFNQLLTLSQVKLPKALEQLDRIQQLFSEIARAREWLQQGYALISTIGPSESIMARGMSSCRGYLDDLTAFIILRQDTLKNLTDPKLFHANFASLSSPQMRMTLRTLLREVEEMQTSCQSLMTLLRQHISRTHFPRRHARSHAVTTNQTTIISTPQIKSDRDLSGEVDLSLRRSSSNNSRVNAGGELSDSNGHSINNNNDAKSTSLPTPSKTRPVSLKGQYQLAWQELVDTERVYVNFLQHVYNVVWMAAKPAKQASPDNASEVVDTNNVPTFMREHQNWLLGNWPELLSFHRDSLLPSLESCASEGMMLKRWASEIIPNLVDLYSVYCTIHPSAVQVAAQLERDKIHSSWMASSSETISRLESASSPGHSVNIVLPSTPIRSVLPLSARLVTPVQRFQRYHMLINQLLKSAITESCRTELTEAHKAMVDVCGTVNLTMRLRGLSMRPSKLGTLLRRGNFTISRDSSRSAQQRHVFLFSNAILLTKFRTHASLTTNPRTAAFTSTPPPSFGDVLSDATDSGGSNHSLSNLPLASNLASLVRSHASGSNLSGRESSQPDCGPVYEIREELFLSEIGLTPSLPTDRKRFAIWTANRSQTYVFHSQDCDLREQWVKSINALLMDQLHRLRDESLRRFSVQKPSPFDISIPKDAKRSLQ